MRFPRPKVPSVPLSIMTAAYLLLLTNFTFWRKGIAYFAGHEWQLAALTVGLLLLSSVILTMFSMKYVIKPVFIFLILVSAVASYFVDTFGILITRDMIQNAVVTTPNEAGDLITRGFILHVLLFGVLPSALIVWIKVVHRSFLAKAAYNSTFIFPSLAVTAGIVAFNYPGYASTFRERGDFMASMNPAAPIVSAVKYARVAMRETNIEVQPLGEDARQGERIAEAGKKVLTVVVIGETARAQSFSLDGYARDTNPELETRGVVNFTDVSSCGTATAVSLPCMFSVYPRSDYSEYKALSTENLTDVLSHAGVQVTWWDNNTGSKGVADHVGYEFLPDTGDARFCDGGECRDGILVDRLRGYFDEIQGNTVLVLHQNGSHGPAYFKRYPAEFERFQPACRTAQFADCTAQEIANAYDNTILYTDHVLSQIIDLLKAHGDEFATSMIYMSDHGESLGEGGLYLHGAPYFLAPETQTKVPFIAWFSDDYLQGMNLDQPCVRQKRDQPYSHDNLFHTVLGLMDVETAAYEPDLDVFAPCRGPIHPLSVEASTGARS